MERIDAGVLHDTVVGFALLKREGSYWDFKREWHSKNDRLLHDIICSQQLFTKSSRSVTPSARATSMALTMLPFRSPSLVAVSYYFAWYA